MSITYLFRYSNDFDIRFGNGGFPVGIVGPISSCTQRSVSRYAQPVLVFYKWIVLYFSLIHLQDPTSRPSCHVVVWRGRPKYFPSPSEPSYCGVQMFYTFCRWDEYLRYVPNFGQQVLVDEVYMFVQV
jgi:hypothetical protein